jgi:hypothetical protein
MNGILPTNLQSTSYSSVSGNTTSVAGSQQALVSANHDDFGSKVEKAFEQTANSLEGIGKIMEFFQKVGESFQKAGDFLVNLFEKGISLIEKMISPLKSMLGGLLG